MAFSADGVLLWSRNVTQEHPEAGRIAALAVDPVGDMWYALGEFGVGGSSARTVGAGTWEHASSMGPSSSVPWTSIHGAGCT